MSFFSEIQLKQDELMPIVKLMMPKLESSKHKGQYGRIGVVGGSFEYTGAPYFTAMAAMRVGADLAHVFCHSEAATVIKSYSPELIVHPVLDNENAIDLIEPWLERLHVVVIGPGLGRDKKIQKTVGQIINKCTQMEKPLVIDADGLMVVNDAKDLIKNKKNIILTPNEIEFQRLFGSNTNKTMESMSEFGTGINVLKKGYKDIFYIPSESKVYELYVGGTGRRCGGQGDLMCGSLAVFLHWALTYNQFSPALLAAFAASFLIKKCNTYGFKNYGRSLVAGDMIKEIPAVLKDYFES